MTLQQQQLAAELEGLTQRAFEAFSEDISGMFDCSMQTIEQKVLHGPVGQLKKDFGKIISINTVEVKGPLQGQCAIWLDQAAIFILSGIVVMLPEKRIQEQVKTGGIKDAQALTDAIKELGNLMTGSWDRIFRQGLRGHKHLKQGSVYIGQIWANPSESMHMEPDHECLMIVTKIKVGGFEPVLCAAVFPVEILDPADDPAESVQTQNQPAAAPAAAEKADTPIAAASAPENIQSPQAQPQQPTPESRDEPAVKVETIEQPVQPSPVSRAIEQLVGSAESQVSVAPTFSPRPAGTLDLNRPIQSLVSTPPVWIEPDAGIQQAILLMQQHNTSYLLVGKNGQLEGLLSRSDTAAAISPYTKSVFANYRRPQDDASFQIRIKWFMSRPVRAVRPETPLWAAMDTLCKYAIRCLVILDPQQRATGLITVFDIFKAIVSIDGSSLAGQISQPPPFLADMTATEPKAADRES
ncbi:MAG: CBS domain-containing protein [Anaerohalosphaeraceae bacterium]